MKKMKELKIIGLTFLMSIFVVNFSAHACGKGQESKCKNKNVKTEVTNIDNGIVITITSDKPEIVKELQERNLNCDKACLKGIKDAKIERNNIENGITVKMTSDNPETVKKLREHALKCKGNCQHKEEEGSPECKERHHHR